MCWFSGNLYPFDGSYMSLDFVRHGSFFIDFDFNVFFFKRNNIVINLCQPKFSKKKETKASASSESEVSKSLCYYYRICKYRNTGGGNC